MTTCARSSSPARSGLPTRKPPTGRTTWPAPSPSQVRRRGGVRASWFTLPAASFPQPGSAKARPFGLMPLPTPISGRWAGVSAQGTVAMLDGGGRLEPLPLPEPGGTCPRVDLVAAYPGADATLMRAALGAGARGIVLQGTGSGNANASLCSEVAAAVAAGVVVITSTRVDAGPVVPIYGAGGGGEDLRCRRGDRLRPSPAVAGADPAQPPAQDQHRPGADQRNLRPPREAPRTFRLTPQKPPTQQL